MKKMHRKLNRHEGFARRWAVLAVTVGLFLAVTGGSAFALLRDTTARVENLLDTGLVTCEVVETFDGDVKKNVKLKNTGEAPAYLRAKVIVNWMDEQGMVTMYPPGNHDYVVDDSSDKKIKTTSWTPAVAGQTLTGGYWYYNGIVQPGELTTDLIDSIKPQYSDDQLYSLHIWILAEAIQASPDQIAGDEGACKEKWHMIFNGSTWVPA